MSDASLERQETDSIEEIETIFEVDVSKAIQKSLSLDSPLLMLIKSESSPWFNTVYQYDLSHHVQELIRTSFVRLLITKESIDFSNFVALFPQFKALAGDCCVILFGGEVIEVLDDNLTGDLIDTRLKLVIDSLTGLRNKRVVDEQRRLAQQTSPSPSPSPAPQNTTDTSINTTTTTTATTTNTLPPTTNTPTPQSHSPVPVPVKKKFKTLKEESAEISAQKYRENVMKQRKQLKLDKERILKLMKQDRLEKSLESKTVKKNEPIHENIRNDTIKSMDEYLLQLKLFDGEVMKLKSPKTDTLLMVRERIIDQFEEYAQLPFKFFNTIERITYSSEDEIKTLEDLNLNKCTLILKPVDRFEVKEEGEVIGGGSFNWLKSTFEYLWGGSKKKSHEQQNQHQQQQQHNQEQELESHDSEIERNIGIDDEFSESDTETLYHSPDIRSLISMSDATPGGQDGSNTLHLNSSNSNFNLYGSLHSGFINDNTSGVIPNSNELSGSGRASPSFGVSSSSRFRLAVDRTPSYTEDRKVYNGNNLSLEDNNDKDKDLK
ncbi:hypothetical protein CANARDRAFT_10010 [[Candida] arabinofermentans NRRL YB-2248]|uniref:UBX domain-containing protein n=1 Tax=[Candida] arabinofermentans NRRL YB-2248 TaxID=983967 RepID=A0A1E4SU52_9ASCO|nr:hypothetical protein CANARDRAFT_10010 [[Candida] arabinofermentans NRRL YB-2248]